MRWASSLIREFPLSICISQESYAGRPADTSSATSTMTLLGGHLPAPRACLKNVGAGYWRNRARPCQRNFRCDTPGPNPLRPSEEMLYSSAPPGACKELKTYSAVGTKSPDRSNCGFSLIPTGTRKSNWSLHNRICDRFLYQNRPAPLWDALVYLDMLFAQIVCFVFDAGSSNRDAGGFEFPVSSAHPRQGRKLPANRETFPELLEARLITFIAMPNLLFPASRIR